MAMQMVAKILQEGCQRLMFLGDSKIGHVKLLLAAAVQASGRAVFHRALFSYTA